VARERVITGEAVEVELPLARLGTRTIALLIDILVQFTLGLILAWAITVLFVSFRADQAIAAAAFVGLVVLVFLIWPVTFETLSRGRSPGKFAMGLRVVRDDGGPIRFRHALVRGLVSLVIEWPGLLAPGVSLVAGAWILLLSPRAKRIGDLAAGTIVLQERIPGRGRYVAAMPPALAPWAASLDLTGVNDDLALTVRQFLSRAHELLPGPRAAIGQQLAEEVLAAISPPPPPGTSGWWFLAAVIAERRRREEQRLARQRALSPFAHPAGPPPAAGYPGVPPLPAPVPAGAAAGFAAAPASWERPAGDEPAPATGFTAPL
jgi:uncharacterized RDD family membrane protein YckC